MERLSWRSNRWRGWRWKSWRCKGSSGGSGGVGVAVGFYRWRVWRSRCGSCGLQVERLSVDDIYMGENKEGVYKRGGGGQTLLFINTSTRLRTIDVYRCLLVL